MLGNYVTPAPYRWPRDCFLLLLSLMTAICAVFGIYFYLLRFTARRTLFVYLLLHKLPSRALANMQSTVPGGGTKADWSCH